VGRSVGDRREVSAKKMNGPPDGEEARPRPARTRIVGGRRRIASTGHSMVDRSLVVVTVRDLLGFTRRGVRASSPNKTIYGGGCLVTAGGRSLISNLARGFFPDPECEGSGWGAGLGNCWRRTFALKRDEDSVARASRGARGFLRAQEARPLVACTHPRSPRGVCPSSFYERNRHSTRSRTPGAEPGPDRDCWRRKNRLPGWPSSGTSFLCRLLGRGRRGTSGFRGACGRRQLPVDRGRGAVAAGPRRFTPDDVSAAEEQAGGQVGPKALRLR